MGSAEKNSLVNSTATIGTCWVGLGSFIDLVG